MITLSNDTDLGNQDNICHFPAFIAVLSVD